MWNGEKLEEYGSPSDAAEHFIPHLSRGELEELNGKLAQTLQKMRVEREDIFEKNSALEDAVGKMLKEKIYLQRQLASAVNAMSEQQKRIAARIQQSQ
mgnify:CR=1 FL=1